MLLFTPLRTSTGASAVGQSRTTYASEAKPPFGRTSSSQNQTKLCSRSHNESQPATGGKWTWSRQGFARNGYLYQSLSQVYHHLQANSTSSARSRLQAHPMLRPRGVPGTQL
uniref:(northern house mosquito) hypothetical protein n=1 Tax=Culex pipiens TaxID=7175 RepID=A0A8D8JBI7_CULPI